MIFYKLLTARKKCRGLCFVYVIKVFDADWGNQKNKAESKNSGHPNFRSRIVSKILLLVHIWRKRHIQERNWRFHQQHFPNCQTSCLSVVHFSHHWKMGPETIGAKRRRSEKMMSFPDPTYSTQWWSWVFKLLIIIETFSSV